MHNHGSAKIDCLVGETGDEGDSELFVDHEGKDSHHGGTALVELDGTLLHLGLLIKGIPSIVDGVVTEVTDEFSSGDVLHDSELKETNQGNNLANSGSRDGVEGGETIWDIGKGEARVVNVSGETDPSLSDEVSDDGEHGDTSVLDLDVTETVELLLVTVGDQAEGIEESKRILGTKLIIERREAGGGGCLPGGGESSGGGDKGGEDGGLHHFDFVYYLHGKRNCDCCCHWIEMRRFGSTKYEAVVSWI
jgi:hypothetical protein